MVKHIVIGAALAVAGVSTSLAQSTVTLQGYLDGSVAFEQGGAAGSIKKVQSGISGPSRLIFRGSEDLGDGMTAFFMLDAGILLDTGSSAAPASFFGRQSFLGLGSNIYGSLRMGLQYNTAFTTMRDVGDPFRLAYAGNAGNIFTAGAVAGPKSSGFPNSSASTGVATGGANRANTVMYTTPKLAGLVGEAAYSFGEQASSAALRTYGLSAAYASGPFEVKLAHIKTNNAAASDGTKTTVLAANYDFKVVKAYLAAAANTAYGRSKNDDYLVGVSVPIGQAVLLASYARKNDKSALNNDAHQVGVAYLYFLSKRTQLYATAGRIANTYPNTSTNFYTLSTPAGPGTGSRLLALGVGHTF